MSINPKLTRGYLNNNPGNIDRGQQAWNGEVRDVSKCTNDVQRRELTQGRFCVFQTSAYGIRAICLNLRAYRDRLGCRSLRDYINRWAPPNENNTEGYIQRVSVELGVNPADPIDIDQRQTIKSLVCGIIMVECAGMPYADAEIDAGLALLGLGASDLPSAPPVEVKPPSSKTVIAGGVAVASGAASIADQIDQVTPVLTSLTSAGASLQGLMKLGGAALSVVALVAVAYMLWRYLQKRRRGEVLST